MKKLRFITVTVILLLALFALIGCNEECQHTDHTVTNAGNGQHVVSCNACDYVATEKCIGGTATCQKGAVCNKCNAAYGEIDTAAHTWINGVCSAAGCRATCDHAAVLTTSNLSKGQHKTRCNVCDYESIESCTGGAASCSKGPICTQCQTEYGEPDDNAHDWNAETGGCSLENCIVICQHIGHATVISMGNAQHHIKCTVCQHEEIRSCTGGTVSCQSAPICENCHVAYGTKDANAHKWNAATGTCDEAGCDATCSHDHYAVGDNKIDDSLHTKTCNVCKQQTVESCTGGSATCETRALCEKCGAAYGTLVSVNAKYKYVVVIGVDGAGTFFCNADTPNIDKIFTNGAITYEMITSNPASGAQSWGSLMHGVTPNIHDLTDSIVASKAYPADSPFPSFFRVIRENDPHATLASFSHWDPINVGIVEDGINVYKQGNLADAALTAEILTYLASTSPTAMFVQFDEADDVGHRNGYNTPTQLAKVTEIDGYIGQIYDAYVQKGIIDETLFIVTADHGGSGKSHDGWTDAEKYVMFAATGRTVKKSGAIENAEIRDTAAIVLHALGHSQPTTWTARVPGDLFVGVDATERPVYIDTESGRYHETEPTPVQGSDNYVTNFVKKALSVYLPFDGDVTDRCGNTTTPNGDLAFTENGYYGGAIHLDEGYVSLNGYALKDESFTVALWIQTQGSGTDPCILSNANWRDGRTKGLTLSLVKTDGVRFNIGNGSKNRADSTLPSDFSEGWMHLIVAVDRESKEIRFYYDFGAPTIVSYDMTDLTFEGIFDGLNIGQDGTGNFTSLPATMDEFMIFEGAFSVDDNNALAKYYGINKG